MRVRTANAIVGSGSGAADSYWWRRQTDGGRDWRSGWRDSSRKGAGADRDGDTGDCPHGEGDAGSVHDAEGSYS